MTTPKRRFYQKNMFWSVVILACIVSPFVAKFFISFWELRQHRPVKEKMDLAILRLSVECPPGLSEDQWAYCVTWTWNLHGNFGCLPHYVPTDDLNRIADELQDKIDRGADLTTIDWIWDQYIEAYPRIQVYDHWRPTALGNKESFQLGAHGGHPLSDWRTTYQEMLAEAGQSR